VNEKVVVLHSGGMDSSTLLYDTANEGYDVIALGVDYGQRHVKELEAAKAVLDAACRAFPEQRFWSRRIDLSVLREHLTGSALTGDVPVPEGHYAEETMRQTIVPNRNAIMISVAAGVAVAWGAPAVYTAVHAGDHHVYADCRPEFVSAMNLATMKATEGFGDVSLVAPLVYLTKADIARLGSNLGVPFALTWSCYVGGEVHCGRCSTCVEREEAFALAGVEDPTEYVDPNFWRQVVANAATGQGL
jgi:7-cyano-7-deazaguanine synthase